MNQLELARPTEAMARSPLLLIDDNADNLQVLESMLEWAGYENVIGCTSALQGLTALSRINPDLVILDLMMPGMDGYEFLIRVAEDSHLRPFLPVLVFTADLSASAKTRALALGASDFLTKPGDAIEIQLKVRNFLQILQRTANLAVARREAVEVLTNACEYRDDETGHHVRRVGELSAGIARELGLDIDFVASILLAAPLHDLGKIGLPDSILLNTGKLSEAELTLMQGHSRIGAELIGDKTSPLLQLAREIAQDHHERWDGAGYPAGLAGEAIPISARIVAVADAYDAITHDRRYKPRRSQFEALNELQAMSGTQFDPKIVPALIEHLRTGGWVLEERKAA